MTFDTIKKPLILGVLFFLPVVFLLFLYPATDNYNTLDIIKGNVVELSRFSSSDNTQLEGNLTVLGFLGDHPNEMALTALNLKEIIYDKFKGFKKFQVVMLVANDSEAKVNLLKKELYQYDELKYWYFAYGSKDNINEVYNSLKSEVELDANLSTSHVFIIDKEKNQRGRIDDREDNQIEKNIPIFGLASYDCIEVAILKNKMAKEDMRVLFTEYRQKRKGNFDSTSRRADDIKVQDEKN